MGIDYFAFREMLKCGCRLSIFDFYIWHWLTAIESGEEDAAAHGEMQLKTVERGKGKREWGDGGSRRFLINEMCK